MVMMPLPKPEIKFPTRPITLPNAADQATFQVLDGNGDNKVSRDEWIRAGWDADRFEAFDANGDGNVSQQEFMQARRYEKEFNDKDWNGDGSLNRTELTGFQLMYAKMQQFGDKAVDRIDGFFPGFKDRFGRMDADGDGKVSKKEYIEARRREETIQIDPFRPIKPRPFPPAYLMDGIRPTQGSVNKQAN